MSKSGKPGSKAGGTDRVFVKDGLRSYRRTFRTSEVRWGLGTGAVLCGVVGWVGWKGAHPDPELFDMSAALASEPSVGAAPVGAASPGRGPFPPGLGDERFVEGKFGRYGAENLYVKINGRAGFFQSFGVLDLYTVTLEGTGEGGAPQGSIDIELYDLGESRNAIGAYNGERPPDKPSTVVEGATFHLDRNAGFLARGQYYVRFIGSDESALVVGRVKQLVELLREQLPGEALPWAFSLFVDQLKLPPSSVTYVRSNAFSFGFASDVFTALLSPPDATDDVEAFVVAQADAEGARKLAAQFRDGFRSLGVAAGETEAGVELFKDEFLGSLSAVAESERWVIGIRGAPDVATVAETLSRLRTGLSELPEEVRQRAVPSEPAEQEAPELSVHPAQDNSAQDTPQDTPAQHNGVQDDSAQDEAPPEASGPPDEQ